MKNLILLEPQALVRSALANLLEKQNLFDKIIPAVSGKNLLDNIGQTNASIVIISTTTNDMSIFVLIKKLKRDFPEIKLLILANELSSLLAAKFFNAGANGYIAKTATPEEFLNTLKMLQQNNTGASESLLQEISQGYGLYSSPFDKLSEREVDILLQMLKGKSVKEISGILHLSPKTISTYKGRIFEKLDVHSLIAIFVMATEFGFIETQQYS